MDDVAVIVERVEAGRGERRLADILIAVPTLNDEGTIGDVLRAARVALRQFPGFTAVIAQVDGGSTDATLQRARESIEGKGIFTQLSYPVYPVHRLGHSHLYLPGKESAYRTIFTLAQELDAKACCIVGGDAAVTPDWIASLLQPVIEMEFDVAAPFYRRHKYDGLLVSGMLYPLIRALFGTRLTQPIGSDVGYSRALISKCLSVDTWSTETARRDIDLWVNLQAMQHHMKFCQVRLGSPRRSRKQSGQGISSIVANLAGATYVEMERTAESWQQIRGSSPVPLFGLRFEEQADGTAPDARPMIDAFRIGCENLQDIWGLVLPPAALLELKRMSRQTEGEFRFSGELWARLIYDFAVAHRLRLIARDHLLRALTPLYLGWIVSFVLSVKDSTDSQAEEQIEQLCLAYESQKPYLISRWRWPDRFMP